MSREPTKDESEQPVAELWRSTITRVVSRFVVGDFALEDFALEDEVPRVAPVSAATVDQIREYLEDYGATLVELDPATWDSSVCVWMGNKWEVLVDLWTEEEGRSDLVLFLFVHEEGDDHRFEVHMVCVP